jgi:hypothetical protein
MAGKKGADVAAADVEPIAAYLASLGQNAAAPAAGGLPPVGPGPTGLTAFATISPLWRGGHNAHVQNPGFFPEAFFGAAWQQTNGPLSARVVACASCHGIQEAGFLSRVELVEAVVRVDLCKALNLDGPGPGLRAAVEAGRLVVPFGAFAEQVNPGVFRTVSKPLIFNMGQRVFDPDLGSPVLPMPYCDEGAVLSLAMPVLWDGLTATVDAYVVNGLAGNSDGIDFDRSRDLADNNQSPAVGGRVTLGTSFLRVGASIMGGRFSDGPPTDAFPGGLRYMLVGADVMAHYEDLIRVQFEYAHRDSDRVVDPAVGKFNERVGGCYLEAEAKPTHEFPVSLLVRYDHLFRHSAATVPESALPTGTFDVDRFTWGFNIPLFGRSLLMLNHEHWFLPATFHDVDVFGVRYAVTF